MNYFKQGSFVISALHLFNAIPKDSVILKPSLQSRIAGWNSFFHVTFPYFLCASSMPRNSPGTATAFPPIENNNHIDGRFFKQFSEQYQRNTYY